MSPGSNSSRNCFRKVLRERRWSTRGSSYGNQASILKAWGKHEEAIALLKRVEAICRELGLREGLRISLYNQAILFEQTAGEGGAAARRSRCDQGRLN
jgi:hypothetical protein